MLADVADPVCSAPDELSFRDPAEMPKGFFCRRISYFFRPSVSCRTEAKEEEGADTAFLLWIAIKTFLPKKPSAIISRIPRAIVTVVAIFKESNFKRFAAMSVILPGTIEVHVPDETSHALLVWVNAESQAVALPEAVNKLISLAQRHGNQQSDHGNG